MNPNGFEPTAIPIDRSVTSTATATMAAVKTVLVADDTAFVRDRFRAAIEGAGHKAVTVPHRRRTAWPAAPYRRAHRPDRPRSAAAAGQRRARCCAPSASSAIRSRRSSSSAARSPTPMRSASSGTLGVTGYVNEYTAVQHIVPSLVAAPLPGSATTAASSPRVVLGIPVAYRFGNTIAAGAHAQHQPAAAWRSARRARSTVGTAVKVRFRLPTAGRRTSRPRRASRGAIAASAWACSSSQARSRVDRPHIDDFVQAHFFSNRKA